MKKLLIFFSLIITLLMSGFVSPVYTAPNKNNVTIVLGDIDLICNPSLNVDWVITDTQVCSNKGVTTGTGNIIVKSTGLLFLINGANVTTNGLLISGTGDRVFVNHGCELWTG